MGPRKLRKYAVAEDAISSVHRRQAESEFFSDSATETPGSRYRERVSFYKRQTKGRILFPVAVFLLNLSGLVGFAWEPDRCEVIPLAENRVSLRIDGIEKTRWNFSESVPRPFFFPFLSPSGSDLTRMGHPGAENHDHHRSVWFAHAKVDGEDYWSENGATAIRQKHWLSYEDGKEEAIMGVRLGWFDPAGVEKIEHDVIAALRPWEDRGEHVLEIQIVLRPAQGHEQRVVLEKSNFGLLAVRVAKSLSHYFGGGQLHSSEGAVGEKEIFGEKARWMNYSGPVSVGEGKKRKVALEGITFFDHPANPRYPTRWHVRSDGWMGASFCYEEEFSLEKGKELRLRYLLHAHSGEYSSENATLLADDFAKRREFLVEKSKRPHLQYEIQRRDSAVEE